MFCSSHPYTYTIHFIYVRSFPKCSFPSQKSISICTKHLTFSKAFRSSGLYRTFESFFYCCLNGIVAHRGRKEKKHRSKKSCQVANSGFNLYGLYCCMFSATYTLSVKWYICFYAEESPCSTTVSF